MSVSDSKERASRVLEWLPLGLLASGVLALTRDAVARAGAARHALVGDGDALSIARWTVAQDFPEVLLQALVLGLLVGYLAHAAAGPNHASRGVIFLLSLVLAVLFTSGFPLEAEVVRARLSSPLGFDQLAFPLGVSIALVSALFFAARIGSRFLTGILPAILFALVAIGWPAWRASQVEPPTFERRSVVRSLLAEPHEWRVLEAQPAAPPEVVVLTPNVHQHTDSADKPSLAMPPPCSVEFTVTAADGDVVLRAAAGIDLTLRDLLTGTPDVETLPITFEVLVDGRLAFEKNVAMRGALPEDWAEDAETPFVWHHVGGADGVKLQPGNVVTLRTSLPEGNKGIAPEKLRAGFAELALERREPRARERATRAAPNVVLIVMDTLRADRMSCYGYTKPTTPHIDALARRGVQFANAYATSSWTWPATASILTGLSPESHGVTSNNSCNLDFALETVAEALQRRGSTTAGFSANPLVAAERSFDQGFEYFDSPRIHFRMSDEVVPGVLEWLERYQSVRFFLDLHLADPHTPHRPHPDELARLGGQMPADFPERGMDQYASQLNRSPLGPGDIVPDPNAIVPKAHQEWIADVYDASVATGDRWVGVFLDKLDELQLTDRTVVAFTADHGEELFDHGLLEHGHTLHRELVRVPLILAGPGIPSGQHETRVVSNRHLAPTLAALGGTELDAADDVDFLLDATGSELATFQTMKGYWQGRRDQALYGLRSGDWVLHWNPAPDVEEGEQARLFNATVDPTETVSRADADRDLAAQLLRTLQARLARDLRYAPAASVRVGAGAAAKAALQAGGYMGGDEQETNEEDDGR